MVTCCVVHDVRPASRFRLSRHNTEDPPFERGICIKQNRLTAPYPSL